MATSINWVDISPTLPTNFIYNSFTGSQQSNTVETNLDAGDVKVRNRSRAYVESYSGNMAMSTAQKNALQTFYRDTLYQGCLSFNFPNPVSVGSIEVRFTNVPKLKYNSNDEWTVSFSIEEIS